MNSAFISLPCLMAQLLFCSTAFSQIINFTDPVASVVVIGSRFSDTSDAVPVGAMVITDRDIRDAGIDNVNEAIRKLAGIYGRQNFAGTQDFSLDINGFGSDSANNLVILLDGVRLSENEQTVALFSSIPIDAVARIEIMRSGSSVLYGDGATGGVIQIITKQTGTTPLTGSVTTELGQFYDRSARAWMSKGWEQFNLSVNLSDQQSDNYRRNNAVTQKNASAALNWYFDQGRAGLRIDSARQQSGLPGALTLAQFEQDPRQSFKPDDYGSIALDRITAAFEQSFGAWQVAAELSARDRTAQADFVSLQSSSTFSGRQTGFTPRVQHVSRIGGLRNESVMGLDMTNWNRQTQSSYSLSYATQQSKAIYFRDEIYWNQARFAFGARRELFNKSSVDPFPGSVDNYAVVQGVNAWEVQGGYALMPMLNVFTKAGQSYRVANVDDNAYTAQPNTPLLPQLSHDMELGGVFGVPHQQLTLRFFRHQLSNEIYFDPTANNGMGANSNLDPTRREGVSVDLQWRLSQHVKFTAQAQHVRAKFTAGVNQGKTLALVPKNTVFAHVNWMVSDDQQAYVGAQWVDTQRYGGDFTNACAAVIPSHVTLDARYAHTHGAWEWAVLGSNLTNKSYFTNAFGCMSGIYSDAGRQLKVSLRYGF